MSEGSDQHALDLAGLVDELADALELMYDKWENGTNCYEDVEEQAGPLGMAFRLTEEEDTKILLALTNAGRDTILSRFHRRKP